MTTKIDPIEQEDKAIVPTVHQEAQVPVQNQNRFFAQGLNGGIAPSVLSNLLVATSLHPTLNSQNIQNALYGLGLLAKHAAQNTLPAQDISNALYELGRLAGQGAMNSEASEDDEMSDEDDSYYSYSPQ